MIKFLKYILFFLACFTSYAISNHDKLIEFLKLTTPMTQVKRNSYFEMGLNSNNEFIFLHSLKRLLKNRHYSSLPIIERLLTQKHHSKQKTTILYTYYHQLKYFSLPEEERVVYLEKRIDLDNPSEFTDLFNWAIFQFGEVANLKHEHSL
ncbi:hypothetical protein MJH12_19085, partial [bacterium]|nr:hypothetical protein [bacterium]